MKPIVTICIRTYSGTFGGKNYDRLRFLKQNMRSIVANTIIPHRIVVIDDASPQDDQIRYLNKIKKQGLIDELVIKPRNLGRQHSFAIQRRIGLKSGTPFVYICDDDYEYEHEWLSTLVEAYEVLRKNWEGRPIGLLSGFNREGATYDSTYEFGGLKYGLTRSWLGCKWLMSRRVLQRGGWLDLAPTKEWPKVWTSPWIDDGSYQKELTSKHGYEHSFTLVKVPSLIDHIGTVGVHAPQIQARGAK